MCRSPITKGSSFPLPYQVKASLWFSERKETWCLGMAGRAMAKKELYTSEKGAVCMRIYDRGVRRRLNELKEDGYALVSIFPAPPYKEASESMSIDDFLEQIERGEENYNYTETEFGLDFTRGLTLYENTRDENGLVHRENKYLIRVHLPADATLYVNVYEVTSHFGGYEEGGWWYDWYECIQSVPVTPKDAERVYDKLKEKYADREWGNIHSIAGAVGGEDVDGSQEIPYVSGAKVVVLVQRSPAKSQTKERPHYE